MVGDEFQQDEMLDVRKIVPLAPTINNAMAPLATRAKAPQISATEPKNSVRMTKSSSGVGQSAG
jgi:hypothetical protein